MYTEFTAPSGPLPERNDPPAGLDTIAKRIEWARKRRGMTKSQLAAEAGTTAGSVTGWTRTNRQPIEPDRTSIIKLARALRVWDGWLQTGRGWFEMPDETTPPIHPKPEALEDRVAILEHALHETRQRCDTLRDAIVDLTELLRSTVGLECGVGGQALHEYLWENGRGALVVAISPDETGKLEPEHMEGFAPNWDHPRLERLHLDHDEIQLNGARARFLRRAAIRANEVQP